MKFAAFEPGDLNDPGSATEALAHWDELDPAVLQRLASHPQHGARLAMLEAVDGWMRERVHDGPGDLCPSADELYDFGRGPGFGALSRERRAAIELHAADCGECAHLVATLATPPPLPLDLDSTPLGSDDHPFAVDVAASEEARRAARDWPARERAMRTAAPTRPIRRWLPLAAAATLIVSAGVWISVASRERTLGFPDAPLLRGEAGGPLYFPRGRVLSIGDALAPTWPALRDAIVFEIAPQPDATGYRIDLFAHAGGAFDTATPVRSSSSAEPTLSVAAAELAPGHYTWRAWALVRGLERELGSRDFTVSADAQIERELSELADDAEPERTLTALHALTGAGYVTDARRLARRLPPSPERDAFLERLPGR